MRRPRPRRGRPGSRASPPAAGVILGAGAERAHRRPLVTRRGEDHDGHRGVQLADPHDRFDPVAVGELEVEEQDVDLALAEVVDSAVDAAPRGCAGVRRTGGRPGSLLAAPGRAVLKGGLDTHRIHRGTTQDSRSCGSVRSLPVRCTAVREGPSNHGCPCHFDRAARVRRGYATRCPPAPRGGQPCHSGSCHPLQRSIRRDTLDSERLALASAGVLRLIIRSSQRSGASSSSRHRSRHEAPTCPGSRAPTGPVATRALR